MKSRRNCLSKILISSTTGYNRTATSFCKVTKVRSNIAAISAAQPHLGSNFAKRDSIEWSQDDSATVLLKAEIFASFSRGQFSKLAVDSFMKNRLQYCDCRCVGDLMRLLGKKTRHKSHLYLENHLPAIALHIESLLSRRWNLMQISFVVYGLQCYSEQSNGVLKILSAMASAATIAMTNLEQPTTQNIVMLLLGLQKNSCKEVETQQLLSIIVQLMGRCTNSFNAQDVGSSLYSLQKMNSSCLKVQGLLRALVPKVISCEETLSAQHVSNALYGMQKMNGNSLEVRALLSALSPMIQECNDTFTSQNVGNALYGLQGMSSRSAEVCAVLLALAQKIESCHEPLLVQHIGSALYGLRGMSSDSSEVCAVLSALAPQIRSCSRNFDGQAVGNVLYGLQGMSSSCPEVRAVLSALIPKVMSCNEILSAQHVGNALYGLQRMNSDIPEVRSLINVLNPKIQYCIEIFSPQAVGNALYGLQGMSSNAPEVRAMLSVLAPKIQCCSETFTSQAIGNALYGLRWMSSDVSEVQSILSVLHDRIASCKDSFSSQHISNVLYGMQGMSDEIPEVRAILSVLVQKIEDCKEVANAKEVCYALYGLQGMRGNSLEINSILSALLIRLQNCEGCNDMPAIGSALYGLRGMKESRELLSIIRFLLCQAELAVSNTSHFQELSYEDLINSGRNITLFLFENKIDDGDRWEDVCYCIMREIQQRLDIKDDSNERVDHQITTIGERRLYQNVLKIVGINSLIKVSANENLFGIFECDVILKIPLSSNVAEGPKLCLTINVEVDGICHDRQKKKQFCALRDRYLQSRGVIVYRIDAQRLFHMTNEDLTYWITEKIAGACLQSSS